MSAETGRILASAGRVLFGPLDIIDGAALEVDIETLAPVRERRPPGTSAWARWSYRLVQGRWAVAMRDAQGRTHRPDDASAALLILAPARFLPPVAWQMRHDDDASVVLQHTTSGGSNVVWRFDSATGMVREATAGGLGHGQTVRLRAASGIGTLGRWSDEVAEIIGLAFVRRRARHHELRVAAQAVIDRLPLMATLELLLEAEWHEPGPRDGQATSEVDVQRFGDRITQTTRIVEHRLGVAFADLGSSQYLGVGVAGAVIDVRSGALTHAVESAGRHRWHVTAYQRTDDRLE